MRGRIQHPDLFEWAMLIQQPAPGHGELCQKLPPDPEAQFPPGLDECRQEFRQQPEAVGNDRCDVCIAQCDSESAIQASSKGEITASNRHIRHASNIIDSRGCSEDLELREVNADIAQEKARPYTPGHYDGRAFDWAILGYGSGYPSASGLDAPYGAIGIFSIVAAETLIVWLMYYEGRTLIRLWLNGRTTEHHLPIPLWIPEGFFFVGLSLLALQLLVMFLKLLIQLEEENPSLKI